MKIIALDVETTGVNPQTDRIVEIAWMPIDPSLDRTTQLDEVRRTYINPEMRIPAEASDIHHITDDMVADAPTFRDIADQLMFQIGDADVIVAYNGTFDIAFLSESFARIGYVWPPEGIKLLDPYKIWVDRVPRSLSSAFRVFTGQTVDEEQAHSAAYDVYMVAAVLNAMEDEYGKDESILTTELTPIVDPAGKISLDDNGEYIFTFGKHVNQRVLDNTGYAKWMLDSNFPESTKETLRRILNPPPTPPTKTENIMNVF